MHRKAGQAKRTCRTLKAKARQGGSGERSMKNWQLSSHEGRHKGEGRATRSHFDFSRGLPCFAMLSFLLTRAETARPIQTSCFSQWHCDVIVELERRCSLLEARRNRAGVESQSRHSRGVARSRVWLASSAFLTALVSSPFRARPPYSSISLAVLFASSRRMLSCLSN